MMVTWAQEASPYRLCHCEERAAPLVPLRRTLCHCEEFLPPAPSSFPPCPFRPPSGVLTRPWPRPTPHLAIPALVAAFASALLTCTIGSCAKLSALLPRQQHMALLSALLPPSLSQQAWATSSLASEPSWMLGLAASMGSMCCQPLREHSWLAVRGATRVRAPGVLMPLLGLLPLLVDRRHLAGAKHLRHSPEPLTLLHLLPWLTVHPVGRGGHAGMIVHRMMMCGVLSYPSILRLAGNTAGAAQKGEY